MNLQGDFAEARYAGAGAISMTTVYTVRSKTGRVMGNCATEAEAKALVAQLRRQDSRRRAARSPAPRISARLESALMHAREEARFWARQEGRLTGDEYKAKQIALARVAELEREKVRMQRSPKSVQRRGSPTGLFDDLFQTGPEPEVSGLTKARYALITRIGEEPSSLDPRPYIRPPALGSFGGIIFWFNRKKAWAIETNAGSADEARKIGVRIRKSLVPKRGLTASEVYLHHAPLHVLYPGGVVTVDGIPEKSRSPVQGESLRSVLGGLRIKPGLQWTGPKPIGGPWRVAFEYDRDREQFVLRLYFNHQSKTVGLSKEDVESRSKSQWMTDKVWRLTPTCVERQALGIESSIRATEATLAAKAAAQ